MFQHPVAIWKDFHRVGQRVPLIGNVSPHGRPGPEALMILEYLIILSFVYYSYNDGCIGIIHSEIHPMLHDAIAPFQLFGGLKMSSMFS